MFRLVEGLVFGINFRPWPEGRGVRKRRLAGIYEPGYEFAIRMYGVLGAAPHFGFVVQAICRRPEDVEEVVQRQRAHMEVQLVSPIEAEGLPEGGFEVGVGVRYESFVGFA